MRSWNEVHPNRGTAAEIRKSVNELRSQVKEQRKALEGGEGGSEVMKYVLLGIACAFSFLSVLPWIIKMVLFYFDYVSWVIKG